MMTAEREQTDIEAEGQAQPALRGHAARAARARILQVLTDRGVLDSYTGVEDPGGVFVFAINGEDMRLRNVEVETFVRGVLVGLRFPTGELRPEENMIRNLQTFAPHDTFSRGLVHGLRSQSIYTIGWKYEQEVLGFLGRLASC